MRKLLPTLVLLLATLPVVADTTLFVRRAAASGPFVDDNFSTSAIGTEWLVQTGCTSCNSGFRITGGVFDNGSTPVQGVVLYKDPLTTDDGHICWQQITNTDHPGPIFRSNSGATGRHYIVRTTTSATIVWRHCTGASCTDMSCGGGACSSSRQSDNLDYLGVQWSGTGASTTITWWDFGATACPADIADWNAAAQATATFTCDSGCQSQITANPTLDGGASNRRFGIYTGSSNGMSWDNYRAWAD